MPIFTANIPTPLKVGDKIEIGGKIKENARKMSVNLCAQEGEEPRDVVLHFDVRFHRDNIISLSRKNGIWIGSGNYDTNYNMFVPGTVFRIIFDIKDTDVITIYCQGKFHSNFLPKIPLSMAKFIVAWADVERVTHCYFHLANKGVSGDDIASPGVYLPQSPRLSPGDATFKHRHRKLSPSSPSPHGETSAESSDEEVPRLKVDGRADKYFYDSLMCDTPDHPKFASPETTRRRDASLIRNKLDYNNRKFKEMTESDKNYSEDYSEIMSKNVDSSVGDTDDMTALAKKKRSRRGKFAQVVNFMSKSKRN